MSIPIPHETNRARFGRIMCETNRDLLINVLHQVRIALLGTGVRAMHRSQVDRVGVRLSLPTRPDSTIPVQQRATRSQVRKSRAMIIADHKSGPLATAAAGVRLKDCVSPIVLQARSCSERGLLADAGLLYCAHTNTVVVHEVTKRNQTGKAVSRVEIVDIPGAQAGGGGGGAFMGGDVHRGLCGHSGIGLQITVTKRPINALIKTALILVITL
jgi:hypothetical protein